MSNQLAEIRKQQQAKYAQEKARRAEQGEAPVEASPAPQGRVIGGKFFRTPPQQMGMKELEAIVNRYQRIHRQMKSEKVTKFCLDHQSADFFQSFLRLRHFQLQRYGIIYGMVKGSEVEGHCIYEPEQHGDEKEFTVLPDANLEKVDKLAAALGLQRVGVITSTPALDDEVILTAKELLLCMEQQAQFGDHCCLIQVRVGQDGKQLRVESYQASSQGVDIFKEGTLSAHPQKRGVVHSERELEAVTEEGSGGKRAMVSKQSTYDVDTIWFTVPVPIGSFTAPLFENRFIRLNRPGQEPPVWPNVRTFLQDSRRRDKPFIEQVSDFHLLLFLMQCGFAFDDLRNIVAAILTRDPSRVDGYEMLIKSYAGMM